MGLRWPQAALVCASLAAGLSAAAPAHAQGAAPVKIGFVVKQPDDPWFQDEWRFAEQAAKDKHFTLVKIAAPSGEKVSTALDSLAAQKAQGVIICAPDVKLGPGIAAKARRYGMKLMSVDDQLVDGRGAPLADVPHMGISAYRIGRQVGDAIAAEAKRRGWRMAERELRARRAAREDRAVVHLRARRGQRQHAAERQRRRDVRAVRLEDGPRIALERHRGRDELRAVDHRAAADREQEIHTLAPRELDRPHQRLVGRVRLDPAELAHVARAERGADLVERAVAARALAAVQHEHAGRRRQQIVQPRGRLFAEDDPGRVVEIEIQHVRPIKSRPVV